MSRRHYYDYKTGTIHRTKPGRRHYTLGGSSDWLGWDVQDVSANNAIYGNLEKMLARVRDLERNDAYVGQHLRLLQANIIGSTGFKFRCNRKINASGRKDKTFNDRVQMLWRNAGKLKNSPTMDGRMSRVDIGNFWIRRLIVDGEVICVKVKGTRVNKFRYAKKFIDPSLLDWRLNEKVRGSENVIKMGVEVDNDNRPVAYHFLKRHRNAAFFEHTSHRPDDYERIPADQVEHSYFVERPGQVRGVSSLAPVGVRARQLDKYEEALVTGARVAASKMAFYIPSEDFDPANIPGMDISGEIKQELEPGTMELLPEGIKGVDSFDPGYPPNNLEEFHKVMVRGIASAMGADYNVMANNLSDVNYSSLRQMELTMRTIWRGLQRFYVEHHEEPDFLAWLDVQMINPDSPALDENKVRGLLEEECYKFQGRGWHWIDPQKEAAANETALANNLTSEPRIIEETLGEDWEDILEEREEFKAVVESKNLVIQQLTDESTDSTTE